MHGNVSEWCKDWLGAYATASQTDPGGPSTGQERVVRGGNWLEGLDRNRSAARNSGTETARFSRFGFRVAASPDPSSARAPDVSSDDGSRAGAERDDNALKLKLCWCPPGTFRMGSPPNEPERGNDEGPVNVTLSRGFWMGKFEVTQSQWQVVVARGLRVDPRNGAGPDHPMYLVSYNEAEEFCRRFTESERRARRLPPGWDYRLPTEAQWEYACRAGTTTATAFGDQLSSADANFLGSAPYNGAAPGPFLDHTSPVGRYRPNAWGLCDTHGNVWEWCADGTAGLSFFDHVEPLRGGVDPVGPASAPGRVMRGGSWRIPGKDLRSAFRLPRPRDFQYADLGFRVARVPSDDANGTSPKPPPGNSQRRKDANRRKN
jgi:formylglycine-generating enzyme required for sulfatase activity